MKPSYQSVQDLLLEFSPLAGMGEESARLKQARKEINPLKSKTDNPVKKAVKATQKARRTKDTGDIAGASSQTAVAKMYSTRHGYPNLTKQLGKHRDTLRKYATVVRKRKAFDTKAAGKQRVDDLRAKLFRLKVQKRAAKPKRR